MITQRLEIRAARAPWLCNKVEIYLAQIRHTDGVSVVSEAQPLQFVVQTEEQLMCRHEPAVRLAPDEAQQLIDELWDAGLRPTQGAGSAGQMAATEKHLEDMRSLVFSSKGGIR